MHLSGDATSTELKNLVAMAKYCFNGGLSLRDGEAAAPESVIVALVVRLYPRIRLSILKRIGKHALESVDSKDEDPVL